MILFGGSRERGVRVGRGKSRGECAWVGGGNFSRGSRGNLIFSSRNERSNRVVADPCRGRKFFRVGRGEI